MIGFLGCWLFGMATVGLIAWGMLSPSPYSMIIGFGGAALCALVAEQFANAA